MKIKTDKNIFFKKKVRKNEHNQTIQKNRINRYKDREENVKRVE